MRDDERKRQRRLGHVVAQDDLRAGHVRQDKKVYTLHALTDVLGLATWDREATDANAPCSRPQRSSPSSASATAASSPRARPALPPHAHRPAYRRYGSSSGSPAAAARARSRPPRPRGATCATPASAGGGSRSRGLLVGRSRGVSRRRGRSSGRLRAGSASQRGGGEGGRGRRGTRRTFCCAPAEAGRASDVLELGRLRARGGTVRH